MILTVYLSKAILCTAVACHPVLVGKATPVGEFEIVQRLTDIKGYGGSTLQFYEGPTQVLSIHRLWLLRPSEQRQRRIKDKDPKQRVITKGCINVEPQLYDQLVAEYHNGTLRKLQILP